MAGNPPPSQQPAPEAERTIVRPRPGGRGASMPAAAPSSPATLDEAALDAARDSRNPLLACAHPLLALIPSLRATLQHPDPAGLREQLSQAVATFERDALARGVARESVVAARYVLCTFIDETAAGTPWGSGVWASDTLLVRFHNETWGGEKVFLLLSRLAENPEANHDLLELIYVCLALGFEGRYKVLPNGRSQLEQLRERLHALLARTRPLDERTLSPHWAPAVVQRRRWLDATPFWVFGAGTLLLALSVYFVYAWLLARDSDQVFASIQALQVAQAKPVAPAPAPPAKRLAGFLEPEIREGLVSVREDAGKSVITFRGDGSFEPGSATVSAAIRPVIDRVARALAEHPGKILVSGHTDSVPIRTARFPSNWHLSQERARSVQQQLVRVVQPERIQAEGRADSEPVAGNDTAAGRAQNRRIEVTLFVAQ